MCAYLQIFHFVNYIFSDGLQLHRQSCNRFIFNIIVIFAMIIQLICFTFILCCVPSIVNLCNDSSLKCCRIIRFGFDFANIRVLIVYILRRKNQICILANFPTSRPRARSTCISIKLWIFDQQLYFAHGHLRGALVNSPFGERKIFMLFITSLDNNKIHTIA